MLGFNKINSLKKKIHYDRFIFLNKLIAFTFSFLILAFYFSFILIIGFKPDILGILLNKSYITVGIVLGLSIIIFSILLTLIYTLISNNFLDKIKEKLK
tara:strand:- start:357 stop:653 length:297 start_codon:yes stop_codon:yes gene_type:complete